MKFILTLDITPEYYNEGLNISNYFVGIVEADTYEEAQKK